MKNRKKRTKEFIQTRKENDEPIKISDILDFLEEKFPDHSRREHRKFLMESMGGQNDVEEEEEIETECPKCEKTAKGHEEVDELFGFRTMSDGKTRVQSWCKECKNS